MRPVMRPVTACLGAMALALAGCMGIEPDKPSPLLTAIGTKGSDFGATLIGTRKQLDFTLSNSDAGFVKVEKLTDIALSVAGTGLTMSHTCPTELAEGSVCFISVYYEPGAVATLVGELRATSNAEQSPLVLALSGSAVAVLDPAAGAVRFDGSPSSDFGTVTVGQFVDRVFTVRNIGNADDTVTVAGPTQDGWTFSHECTAALAPDATCAVTVRFAPTATGPSIPSPLVLTDAYNTDYGGLTIRLGGVGQ
jgi:hypothetical protein